MKQTCLTAICVLLLSAAQGWGAEESKGKTIDDYRLLSQRNIFSRERHAVVVQAETVKQPVITRSEQSYYVLRGVAKQGNATVAFVENTGTSQVSRVKAGESVAGGKISAITLDSLSYELSGTPVRVTIGMTLEGKLADTSAQSYSASGYSGQQQNSEQQQNFGQEQNPGANPSVQSETPAVSEEAAGDILQRLKERRKKELGE